MHASYSAFATKPFAKPVAQPGHGEWHSYPRPTNSHQDSSCRLILSAAEAVDPGEVLILGAGECREIPISQLARRFQSMTIQDIEPTFLETAIRDATLSWEQSERIELITAELNGFDDSDVDALFRGIQDSASAQEGAELLADRLLYVAPAPFKAPRKADLVIASCVMSQLHIPFLNAVTKRFQSLFPHDGDALVRSSQWSDAAFQLAEQMEETFLYALRSNVRERGRIYFSDTTHLVEYRVTESGQWQSRGSLRTCRFPTLPDYTERLFRSEQREVWWWEASAGSETETGFGFRVEGAVLATL